MIRKLTICICIFFYFTGFSQLTIDKRIYSEYLNDFRNIKIYLPEGYEKDSIKKYPLSIVLDEEYLFYLYVGNSILFANKDKAPKQIVVGISMNRTRRRDTYFNKKNGNFTKGSVNFYKFIRDELIYEIESNFRISPFVSLVGEGTSANIVAHFLREEEPTINSYICIDPTFSDFVNREFVDYHLEKLDHQHKTFYLYTNNSTSFSRHKQENIEHLQDFLAHFNVKNLHITNDKLKTDSSISAISEAIPRALTKNFEIYSAITKEEFNTKIKHLSPTEAMNYLKNKYIEIEALFGSGKTIRKRDIFTIENIILNKENGEKLKEYGNMILDLYPYSPLGNYYTGLYYEKKQNNKKALDQYKIGYGKMDPSDPKAYKFYQNVLRVDKLKN